ncbi:peptidase [Corticimicrobacter populi]|uniref:Peptidase n=2 Tax=Corticimicrobacter populi TaxID=2175229 RepID=A0A2V1K704_9BURK|nr:peptidase [Corticimicrobacter populi]
MPVRVSPTMDINQPLRSQGGRLLAASLLVLALAACTTTDQRAPIRDMSQQRGGETAQQAAQPALRHVVKPGDTLYQIARRYQVDAGSVIAWNQLSDPSRLRPGQELIVSAPGSSTAAAQSGTSSTAQVTPITDPSSAEVRPVDLNAGSQSSVSTGSDTPAATTTTPSPSATAGTGNVPRAADANVIAWGWPASGELIQSFGGSSRGIDISGTAGDPIYAAADGKVMFTGSGVRGRGNLIIINHQRNAFITVYAHNRSMLVKAGQDVKKGDKIAEMGQTDTTSPRLYFEIRRQGTPVNPLGYLPAK